MDFMVGIDPGLKGGLVALDPGGGILRAARMPIETVSGKKRPSPGGLEEFFEDVCFRRLCQVDPSSPALDGLVTIEQQGHRRWDGGASGFTTASNYGFLLGWLHGVLRLPVYEVQPSVWKESLGYTGTAKRAVVYDSMTLWPTLTDLFNGPGGDGVADAALIARYGLKKLRTGASHWVKLMGAQHEH